MGSTAEVAADDSAVTATPIKPLLGDLGGPIAPETVEAAISATSANLGLSTAEEEAAAISATRLATASRSLRSSSKQPVATRPHTKRASCLPDIAERSVGAAPGVGRGGRRKEGEEGWCVIMSRQGGHFPQRLLGWGGAQAVSSEALGMGRSGHQGQRQGGDGIRGTSTGMGSSEAPLGGFPVIRDSTAEITIGNSTDLVNDRLCCNDLQHCCSLSSPMTMPYRTQRWDWHDQSPEKLGVTPERRGKTPAQRGTPGQRL